MNVQCDCQVDVKPVQSFIKGEWPLERVRTSRESSPCDVWCCGYSLMEAELVIRQKSLRPIRRPHSAPGGSCPVTRLQQHWVSVCDWVRENRKGAGTETQLYSLLPAHTVRKQNSIQAAQVVSSSKKKIIIIKKRLPDWCLFSFIKKLFSSKASTNTFFFLLLMNSDFWWWLLKFCCSPERKTNADTVWLSGNSAQAVFFFYYMTFMLQLMFLFKCGLCLQDYTVFHTDHIH